LSGDKNGGVGHVINPERQSLASRSQLGVAAALSGAVAFGHFPGMLLFLATILEQLDLALEHVLERDIHNARFGLMLTDNALELVLHQIARDKVNYLRLFGGPRASYTHQAALDKALGRSFSDKVNFVRVAGLMSEKMAQTIGIMHGVRNEVYHVGLQHEAILPSLSLFYFNVACTYICSYKPPFLTWSSNQKLPARAKKYFRRDGDEFGEPDDFRQGCDKLALDVGHKPAETIAALADHFDEAIQQQDACIDTIAEGVYPSQRTTRDDAFMDCQIRSLAFSEVGKAYARKNGFTGSTIGKRIEWIEAHYPLKYRSDPISRWRKQAVKLRAEKNANAALRRYYKFMTETASIRESISESAALCEAEIDREFERARGN
jgi:hypothetical protein